MFNTIIFDWNGTIINDVQACLDILCTMLNRYGLKSVTMEEYREAFTFPVIEYYKKVGFVFDNYTFEEVASHFVPMYDEVYPKCKLYDGIVDLIKKLKGEGKNLYLLSATEKSSLYEQTEYFKVRDLFKEILGTDNFHGKSKTEEAKDLIKRLDCNLDEILFIGDTEYDYKLASELGVQCALLDYGHKPPEILKKYTKNVFSSVSELEKFLCK